MIKQCALILGFSFMCSLGYSQGIKNDYMMSYFGRNGTHPGVKIGFNHPLFVKEINRVNKKNITRIHSYQIDLQSSIGYYYHKNNQHGLFINIETGCRYFFNKSFMIGLYGGIGFNRTFLDGKVYTVSNNFKVRRIYGAGNNLFMPSLSILIAHSFRKNELPKMKCWFVKVGAFWQYPFNTKFLLNPFLEFGVAFKMKNEK